VNQSDINFYLNVFSFSFETFQIKRSESEDEDDEVEGEPEKTTMLMRLLNSIKRIFERAYVKFFKE
jgi:hypothetical protein